MPGTVSSEEQEQILQTIQMFEVITQANAGDCQSLEILKEAYWKLGRQTEALGVTRRLADAYRASGQYSSALLEYEGILEKDPESPGVADLIAEVEARLKEAGITNGETLDIGKESIDVDFSGIQGQDADLITTQATRRPEGRDLHLSLDNDGNEALAKFLIQHRLAPEDVVTPALERVQKKNRNLEVQDLAASLIDEVVHSHVIEMPALLCGILDRSKFAYVPLDYYDVDRQIVKMLPESLTLGRLIVPFDLISRTVMVAMANPFDAKGKEAVQQLFDYSIQWHLAAPDAIYKVLRDAYRLDARD